jgi:hypothetical protein
MAALPVKTHPVTLDELADAFNLLLLEDIAVYKVCLNPFDFRDGGKWHEDELELSGAPKFIGEQGVLWGATVFTSEDIPRGVIKVSSDDDFPVTSRYWTCKGHDIKN